VTFVKYPPTSYFWQRDARDGLKWFNDLILAVEKSALSALMLFSNQKIFLCAGKIRLRVLGSNPLQHLTLGCQRSE